MKFHWSAWILFLLSFCERICSERRLFNNDTEDIKIPSKNSCRFAQLKCSYRSGCGSTLQSFIIECDGLIHNKTDQCSNRCKNTLVGLTSTIEGQKLMTCNCDGDVECEVAKLKIEVCRDLVTFATRNDTVVSCTEARWICHSDAECGKALEYYHSFCRSMFRGKNCTERCKNSLNILRRQTKAMKLIECQCGTEEKIDDFLCSDIKKNMQNLCYEPEIFDETTLNPILEFVPVNENVLNEIEVDDKKPIVKSSGEKFALMSVFQMCLIFILTCDIVL